MMTKRGGCSFEGLFNKYYWNDKSVFILYTQRILVFFSKYNQYLGKIKKVV